MIDNKDDGDGISITEDDESDILVMISTKRSTSLSSSIINIINDEECDGIAEEFSGSPTTHYCNDGSTKRPTSLSSSIINIINDEERDEIAEEFSGSPTTHYCNGGSAGSQSNTSSQRASCTSATPLSTDT